MDRRIWGDIDWLVETTAIDGWSLVAALATEDRCTSIIRKGVRSSLRSTHLLDVRDPISHQSETARRLVRQNGEYFYRSVDGSVDRQELLLMATGRDILEAKEHIADSAEENIILDISCMPKRIFFPILKFLILDESVRNLAVAYSVPENYPAGDLAHDPLEWAQLPTYSRVEAMPDTGSASVIVGVGFSPFQLPSLLDEHYKDSELSLLFPFPPGPPQFQRNWAFVGEVKWWYPRLTDDNILRIHAYDTPRCYDTIKGLLTDESESVIFAPFGPKPHSLAMCVYAINHDSDVFYTQPQIYSPDYSRGMQRNADGTPKCIGYLVKYEGELLYS